MKAARKGTLVGNRPALTSEGDAGDQKTQRVRPEPAGLRQEKASPPQPRTADTPQRIVSIPKCHTALLSQHLAFFFFFWWDCRI